MITVSSALTAYVRVVVADSPLMYAVVAPSSSYTVPLPDDAPGKMEKPSVVYCWAARPSTLSRWTPSIKRGRANPNVTH